MASFNIHLAVGKRYLEKNNSIKNTDEFYRGIIEPDLVSDKKSSHHTGVQDKNDLLNYLANKVLLNEYLKKENIDFDYNKGVFLHLITDYLFFNNFFNRNYLDNISYAEFCKDLYYSYDFTNDYLQDKYNLDNNKFMEEINNNIAKDKKEKNTSDEIRTNILPFTDLDNFIEYVSNINLEDYKSLIIDNDGNILP